MIAALFFRHVLRCRSVQLALTFSLPPTNHLANGSFHSSTLSNGFIHVSDLACSAQKPSGSFSAHAASRSRSAAEGMCAAFANSAGGGKRRVSFRTLVMLVVGEDIGTSAGRWRARSEYV